MVVFNAHRFFVCVFLWSEAAALLPALLQTNSTQDASEKSDRRKKTRMALLILLDRIQGGRLLSVTDGYYSWNAATATAENITPTQNARQATPSRIENVSDYVDFIKPQYD